MNDFLRDINVDDNFIQADNWQEQQEALQESFESDKPVFEIGNVVAIETGIMGMVIGADPLKDLYIVLVDGCRFAFNSADLVLVPCADNKDGVL